MPDFNKPLLAFDAEIAAIMPEGETDWNAHKPLGISCVGMAYLDLTELVHGKNGAGPAPRMSREECRQLVWTLMELAHSFTLVGWNSLAFDWQLLADESEMYEECTLLALRHVDLMFMVVAAKGHYLGLDKAARGMNLEGKRKKVQLSDGSYLEDMNGAKAPQLWADGEYEAVLDYLEGDVLNTLQLAQAMKQNKCLRWLSNAGRPQQITFDRLLTVQECLALPEPDTRWMTNPPSRLSFTSWFK